MTTLVLKAAEAVAQFRLGKEIDYRTSNEGKWIPNPFADSGTQTLSVVDAALGDNVRFRIRPPLCRTEQIVRDFGRKGMDGDTYLKVAQLSVRRALADVRSTLASRFALLDREFVDDIEREYCGTPEVKSVIAPAKVEIGQRWRYDGDHAPYQGKTMTVRNIAGDGDLAYFEAGGAPGGYFLYRFLTLHADRAKWLSDSPRFTFVGGKL